MAGMATTGDASLRIRIPLSPSATAAAVTTGSPDIETGYGTLGSLTSSLALGPLDSQNKQTDSNLKLTNLKVIMDRVRNYGTALI
jgi:hypothetical protein